MGHCDVAVPFWIVVWVKVMCEMQELRAGVMPDTNTKKPQEAAGMLRVYPGLPAFTSHTGK